MTERRKFTTDFQIGDYVDVIRTEHGWFDGSLLARISHLGEYHCTVMDGEGIPHEIPKPRDIRKNGHPGVKISLEPASQSKLSLAFKARRR